MAGGSGSRLWPLSRGAYPKQFLRLCGEHTMLQETLRRLHGLPCAAPLVICNEEHRFVVAEQLRELGQLAGNIILEPVGRNTAPCIGLGAMRYDIVADLDAAATVGGTPVAYANDLSEAMVKVRAEGRRDETLRMVGNELNKRTALALEMQENPIVDRVLQVSYFANLGLSPAFLLTNMTQVPMITAVPRGSPRSSVR